MRVPIISPSTAVNPIDEATLRPSRSAHIDEPLPRWAITTAPFARSPISAGNCRLTYS